jgi:flavin reductase (DIM6/NTAB) family NADH-FMN oxidoreductase RutF
VLTVTASAQRSSPLISLTLPNDIAAPLVELMHETGTFALNVLPSSHAGLAARFDRPQTLGPEDRGDWFLIDEVAALRTAFVTVLCRVDRVLDAGDHQVILAVPLHASFGGTPSGPPLGWQTSYGATGDVARD